MVIFATATVLAFALLHDSRFNFHCYTQHEPTPTQKSAQKCTATSHDSLCERLQSAFTLANQLCWITQQWNLKKSMGPGTFYVKHTVSSGGGRSAHSPTICRVGGSLHEQFPRPCMNHLSWPCTFTTVWTHIWHIYDCSWPYLYYVLCLLV